MKYSKLFIAFIVFTASLFFAACIKDEYPAKGYIVGYDLRDCACCGGYYINLDNNNTLNDNTKVAGTLPSDFVFDSNELPLKVQLDWVPGGGCLSNNIIVKKIKRR